MLVAFSVAPSESGPDGSVSEAVAGVVALVRDSGLPNRTDAMFTTLEGSWEECMDVVRRCVELLAESAPRVSLVLKADVRPGRTGELAGKLDRLEAALARREEAEGAGGADEAKGAEGVERAARA